MPNQRPLSPAVPPSQAPSFPARKREQNLRAGVSHASLTHRRMRNMALFSPEIETLEDLYLHTLQDIYYAENQIVKALPTMIEKAGAAALSEGLQQHLGETRGH